ncbi:MAG: hypothetical protein Q9165_004526 [Trypethelium subeluteriae]
MSRTVWERGDQDPTLAIASSKGKKALHDQPIQREVDAHITRIAHCHPDRGPMERNDRSLDFGSRSKQSEFDNDIIIEDTSGSVRSHGRERRRDWESDLDRNSPTIENDDDVDADAESEGCQAHERREISSQRRARIYMDKINKCPAKPHWRVDERFLRSNLHPDILQDWRFMQRLLKFHDSNDGVSLPAAIQSI